MHIAICIVSISNSNHGQISMYQELTIDGISSHNEYGIFDFYYYDTHCPFCLLMWRDRLSHVATNPVVMRPSLTTDIIYVMDCWLINPKKINLLSRLSG